MTTLHGLLLCVLNFALNALIVAFIWVIVEWAIKAAINALRPAAAPPEQMWVILRTLIALILVILFVMCVLGDVRGVHVISKIKNSFSATVAFADDEATGDGVEFSGTEAAIDQRTNEVTAVATHADNDTDSTRPVWVQHGGVRQQVGTLAPGEGGTVVVVPGRDGRAPVYVFEKDGR